ncbi:hypothetical protein AGG09_01800 (plasmid) [Klebsiella pneumoniae]|nr:hypothetical protein AB186_01800 [Klebsiella pneumoniae]ALR28440.1 hypothetical protein AGG09_01800 [Klebsiella pneumoniae]
MRKTASCKRTTNQTRPQTQNAARSTGNHAANNTIIAVYILPQIIVIPGVTFVITSGIFITFSHIGIPHITEVTSA